MEAAATAEPRPKRQTPTCKRCGQRHHNFVKVCPPKPPPLLIVHRPREGYRPVSDQTGDTFARVGGSTFGVRGRKDSDYWRNPPPAPRGGPQ